MLDIRELMNLKEAYAEVYAPQELTEEQVWEEVETWVNSLIEEGYDLSDYTWEEMFEAYLEEAPMTAFQAAGGQAKLNQLNKGLSPRSGRATAQSIERQGQQNLYKAGGGDAAIAKGPTRAQNVRGGGQTRVSTTTRQDVINRGTVAGGAKPATTPAKPTATPAAAKPTPTATTPAKPTATPAAAKPTPTATRPAATAPAAPRPGAPARPAATAAATPTRPAASSPAPKPAAATAPAAKPSAGEQFAKANPKIAAASAERDRTRGTSATTNPLMKDMKSRLPAPKTPSPTTAKTGFDLAKKGVNLAAGFDMFDVVKGYLIGEGYADTEEAALAIMSNMSEEWKQSIIVEAQVANRNPDEYERKEKKGQSREQQLKGRVMGRMSQMDPDKKAAMLKQMRAVGLDV